MPVEKPATDEGIISPEGQIEALKQDTDKMISRFVDKVIAMTKRSSEKAAMNILPIEKKQTEKTGDQGQKLIDAINNKDFDYLHNILFTSNKASIGLFSEYTGLPVGTNKEINQSIAALDPEAYKNMRLIKNKQQTRRGQRRKNLDKDLETD